MADWQPNWRTGDRSADIVWNVRMLEKDLLDALRSKLMFGNWDEPMDDATIRVVRIIQQRLAVLLAEPNESPKR